MSATHQTTVQLSYSLCMRGLFPSFILNMNYENILFKCLKELNIDSEEFADEEFKKFKLKSFDRIARIENILNLKNMCYDLLNEDLIVYYTCFLLCVDTYNNKSAYFYNLLSEEIKKLNILYLDNKKNRK